jgi:hypothetical protein
MELSVEYNSFRRGAARGGPGVAATPGPAAAIGGADTDADIGDVI